MSFKDHFSSISEDYARFRPTYPDELYQFILKHVSTRSHAWDCATGNGQAAIKLASYFEKVTATDASQAQVESAVPHEKVSYEVALAEDSGLDDNSVDLVTVAQALHWFNFDEFYEEVSRVASKDAIFATWSYGLFKFSNPQMDQLITEFYDDIVGPYWPPERVYTDHQYRTIPFPFNEIESPTFYMEMDYSIEQVINYLGTWSAVKNYRKEVGQNPLPGGLFENLQLHWNESIPEKTVKTPIYLRMGRIE